MSSLYTYGLKYVHNICAVSKYNPPQRISLITYRVDVVKKKTELNKAYIFTSY